MAGLKAARARGRKGGRPKKLQAKEIKTIRALLKTAEISVQEVAKRFGVSRSTLYRKGLLTQDQLTTWNDIQQKRQSRMQDRINRLNQPES